MFKRELLESRRRIYWCLYCSG